MLRVVGDRTYEPAGAAPQVVCEACAHFHIEVIEAGLDSFLHQLGDSLIGVSWGPQRVKASKRSRVLRGVRSHRRDLAILQTSHRRGIFVVEHAGPFCFENSKSVVGHGRISIIPERGRLDELLLERAEQRDCVFQRTPGSCLRAYKSQGAFSTAPVARWIMPFSEPMLKAMSANEMSGLQGKSR